MENSFNPSVRIHKDLCIKWGLISGSIGIAIMLIINMLNVGFMTGMMIQGILGLGSGLVILYLMFKSLRDEIQVGYMTIWQAVANGVLTMLISGVISYIFMHIYINFIDTGYVDRMVSETIELAEKLGGEAAREAAEASSSDTRASMALTPWNAVKTIISTIVMGSIISLIFGAIMKKTPADIKNNQVA